MTCNTIFIVLGNLGNYLQNTTLNKSTLPPGSCKTSLNTSRSQKSLSVHCKQINKIKNELDWQPSSLLACIHVSNYKTTFSSMHLVFLELDTHRTHLNFKIFNENNNVIILRISPTIK